MHAPRAWLPIVMTTLLASSLVAVGTSPAHAAGPQSARILVQSNPNVDGRSRARIAGLFGIEVVRDIGVLRTTVLEVPTAALDVVRAQLVQQPGITDVSLDPITAAADVPTPAGALPIPGLDLPPFLSGVLGVVPGVIGTLPQRSGPDPLLERQWGLAKIRAQQAWSQGEGNDQLVAVIDSGVDYNHLDLVGKVSPGHDWVADDDDPMDPLLNFSHGTHVAGIIAANTSNSRGIAGTAPRARILAVRALGTNNTGYHSDIASGIVEATDRGARVINLSLGGPTGSTVLEGAIAYAAARGVFLACSTGNDSASTISYPAAYDGCFAVGASDSEDQRATFSNSGTGIDLVAPGTSVLSLAPTQLYSEANGTSMAAPFVAGTAALLMSQGLAAPAVRDRLTSTSTDLGPRGYDTQFGWGRLDAAAATGASTPIQAPPGAPRVTVPNVPSRPGTAPRPGKQASTRASVRIVVRQRASSGATLRCGASQRRACTARRARPVRFLGTASSARSTTGRTIVVQLCKRSGARWKCARPLRTSVRARGKFAFTIRPMRGVWRIDASLPSTARHAAARSKAHYVRAK